MPTTSRVKDRKATRPPKPEPKELRDRIRARPPMAKKRNRRASALHDDAPKRVMTPRATVVESEGRTRVFTPEPRQHEEAHNNAPWREVTPVAVIVAGAEALSFRSALTNALHSTKIADPTREGWALLGCTDTRGYTYCRISGDPRISSVLYTDTAEAF